MTRFDLDQQVDYGDGTLAWAVTSYSTRTYRKLMTVYVRAQTEGEAYEQGREQITRRNNPRLSKGWWTLVVKPASYEEMELRPMAGKAT